MPGSRREKQEIVCMRVIALLTTVDHVQTIGSMPPSFSSSAFRLQCFKVNNRKKPDTLMFKLRMLEGVRSLLSRKLPVKLHA